MPRISKMIFISIKKKSFSYIKFGKHKEYKNAFFPHEIKH